MPDRGYLAHAYTGGGRMHERFELNSTRKINIWILTTKCLLKGNPLIFHYTANQNTKDALGIVNDDPISVSVETVHRRNESGTGWIITGYVTFPDQKKRKVNIYLSLSRGLAWLVGET